MTNSATGPSFRELGGRLFVRSAMSAVTDVRAAQFVSADNPTFAEDTSAFGSGLPGGVAPVFAGNGSRITNPELLVVFWGPYWPGSGALNQAALTSAFNTIVTGPYLSGLAQYGYAGPVSVRTPLTISSPPNIALPLLKPGVQQSVTVYNAVLAFVESLVNNDTIGGTDDNHDLIVMVVIDPILPFPQDQNSLTAAVNPGGITTVFGAHGKLEIFEFLDDNTRFAVGWVGTQGGTLGVPDQTTSTFSHELAEAITDPFPNSGWVQTAPAAGANQGEIGDVCSAVARLDGVTVQSYWSIADQACIVPTEHRTAYLTEIQGPRIPHDGPSETIFHDFGALCGSGTYGYVERTYENKLTIHSLLTGYQSPALTWTVNGVAVAPGITTQVVPATWESPGPPPRGTKTRHRVHPPTTLRLITVVNDLLIEVGPNAGDTSFTVTLTVKESWDNLAAATANVTTQNFASHFVAMTNQEIVWGSDYERDRKECNRRHHLANGPNSGVWHPPTPGDPGDIAGIVLQALLERGQARANALRDAAKQVKDVNPGLAAQLDFIAAHPPNARPR